MHLVYRIKKYVQYLYKAQTQYYLHSPFVYQFYLNVLIHLKHPELTGINKLRTELAKSSNTIDIKDLGTGKNRSIRISKLEKNIAVRKKYGELLYRLVKYYKPAQILELGTSIGISSAYIALGNSACVINSIEGSKNIAQKAKEIHAQLGLSNVHVSCNDFSVALPVILQQVKEFDLILFDGNHTKEATLSYFYQCIEAVNENSIFIFDDIYWSTEMTEAWQEIINHPKVTTSIDVYQYGICFFRKEKLSKENFVLRY